MLQRYASRDAFTRLRLQCLLIACVLYLYLVSGGKKALSLRASITSHKSKYIQSLKFIFNQSNLVIKLHFSSTCIPMYFPEEGSKTKAMHFYNSLFSKPTVFNKMFFLRYVNSYTNFYKKNLFKVNFI